jgi:hypothetical protein
MPRWLWTTLRLTPIVAGASALSVFGLFVFRGIVPQSELAGSSGEVGNYLQTVGGIYAVLLAFVVYVVWGQFNEARAFCDREAASLIDLHRTVGALPHATRDDIQKALHTYVDAVIADEWQAMARGDEATIERVGERLDHVWHAIHACEPSSECQHTVYSEVLTQFNDLMDLRTSRLSSARARMPLAMKVLLVTGAVITTCSMYLLAFDKVWIHAVVTGALAGAIAHVLFLIVDLDDAFAGDWQVAKAPFVRARRTMERNARAAAGAAAA